MLHEKRCIGIAAYGRDGCVAGNTRGAGFHARQAIPRSDATLRRRDVNKPWTLTPKGN
ncbi:MAG TPA: hypothetical protein PLL20_11620 [Phycisphaerae bacterium]|nr:hypothetical protein [Phycisphaerae bacterium]HRR84253.1 hypothetical protein [Phycisphaerae bacterium]